MTKKDRIVELHAQGFTSRQIAKMVPCEGAYIRAALQRHQAGGSRVIDKIHGARTEATKAHWRRKHAAAGSVEVVP